MIHLKFELVWNKFVLNIYTKKEVGVVFVLFAVIGNLVVVNFWFLKLSILFWKI